jgi:hypothetical protein
MSAIMEKIDILVKGVPVPTHNMFKGLCSVAGKSVSEGVIEAMGDWIRKYAGTAMAKEPSGKQGKRR